MSGHKNIKRIVIVKRITVWNYGVIGKNLTSPNANINAYIRFYDVERIEKCYYHFPWKYISCLPKSQSYA